MFVKFRTFCILSLVFSCLFINTLQAQNYGTVNSHRFRFSDTLETVGLEGSLHSYNERLDYRFNIVASYDYAQDSVVAKEESSSKVILKYVRNLQTFNLGGSYLFGSKRPFLLGFHMPIHRVRLTEEGSLATGGEQISKDRLGDIRVYGKWRLAEVKNRWGLGLLASLSLPSGDKKYLISDGGLGGSLRFLLNRQFSSLPLSLYSHLGYSYHKKSEFLSLDRRHLMDFGLGFFWSISPLIGLNLEAFGDIALNNLKEESLSLDVLFGPRLNFSFAKVFAGLSLSGLETSGNETLGFYLGMKIPLLKKTVDPGPKVVLESPKKKVKISHTTLFAFDRSTVAKSARKALDKVAATIVHFQDRLGTILIEGHTDTRGPRAYNQRLSERRAKAVKDHLIMRGVLPEKLKIVGYGKDRPIYHPEKNNFERRANRRAEFLIDESITIREEDPSK